MRTIGSSYRKEGKGEKKGGEGRNLWLTLESRDETSHYCYFEGGEATRDNSLPLGRIGKKIYIIFWFWPVYAKLIFLQQGTEKVRGLFYFVQMFHIAKVTRVTSQPQNYYQPQGTKGNEGNSKGRFQSETKTFKIY